MRRGRRSALPDLDLGSRRSGAVLAGALTTMGVLHMVAPKPFDQLIPDWLPGSARALAPLAALPSPFVPELALAHLPLPAAAARVAASRAAWRGV